MNVQKVHPRTGHEGPKWEWRYSSTLSLTTAIDGVGGQCQASDTLPPRKTRYPLYRRVGGPQERSGRVRETSPPPGFEPRTVRSQSLHRLRDPGPHQLNINVWKQNAEKYGHCKRKEWCRTWEICIIRNIMRFKSWKIACLNELIICSKQEWHRVF